MFAGNRFELSLCYFKVKIYKWTSPVQIEMNKIETISISFLVGVLPKNLKQILH